MDEKSDEERDEGIVEEEDEEDDDDHVKELREKRKVLKQVGFLSAFDYQFILSWDLTAVRA